MKKFGKQSLYNIWGNLIYLLSQWLLTVITTRVCGFEEAGILALAIAFGNIICIIQQYGGRSFQVSDVDEQYSINDYITFRCATVATGIVVSLVSLNCLGYSGMSFSAIMIFVLYRSSEAISDSFFGEMQKKGRLDLFAVSMTGKSVIGTFLFVIIIKETKSLPLSLTGIAVIAALITLFLDYRNLKRITAPAKMQLSFRKSMSLLRDSTGIFISCILPVIVTSFPRMLLEKYYNQELLGFYGDVSTPTALITAVVPSMLIPIMTWYGNVLKIGESGKVLKGYVVSMSATVCLCIVCMFGVAVLGKQVMSLIYTNEILPYVHYLYPLLISTTMYAMTMCGNSILICVRKNKEMTVCSLISFLVCIFSGSYLVSRYAINGAIVTLCISYGVQMFFQNVCIVSWYRRTSEKTKNKKQSKSQIK